MQNIKKIIAKFNSDPIFKKKVMTAGLMAVGSIVFLIYMTLKDNPAPSDQTATDETKKETVDNYFIADTSKIVDDKNQMYQYGDRKTTDGSEINLGKVEGQPSNDNAEVDAYMAKRENSMNRMNNSGTAGYTPQRRSYNPTPNVTANRSSINYQYLPINNTKLSQEIIEQKETEQEPSENDNDFFTSKKKKQKTASQSLIYACIHTDQSLKDGSRIKMRLTKTTEIDNNIYPINTILYGTAKIRPNRLIISINKVNQTDVKLTVYDAEDSNIGIYVETPQLNQLIKKELKTEVTREAAREDELSKIPFSQTLRNLFNKKLKEEQIEVLNNYKIIIKNDPLEK